MSPERISDSCDEIVLLVPEALNGKPKKVIEKKLVENMDETNESLIGSPEGTGKLCATNSGNLEEEIPLQLEGDSCNEDVHVEPEKKKKSM